MATTKKSATLNFLPESCGACHYCISNQDMARENLGECHATPPAVVADEDGVVSVRPVVEFGDFPCKYFRLRAHS